MCKHGGFSRKNTTGLFIQPSFPLGDDSVTSVGWQGFCRVWSTKKGLLATTAICPALPYQTLFSLCIECLDCAVASLLGTQSKRPFFKLPCSVLLTTRCIARLTKQASLEKNTRTCVAPRSALTHLCMKPRGHAVSLERKWGVSRYHTPFSFLTYIPIFFDIRLHPFMWEKC